MSFDDNDSSDIDELWPSEHLEMLHTDTEDELNFWHRKLLYRVYIDTYIVCKIRYKLDDICDHCKILHYKVGYFNYGCSILCALVYIA